MARVKFLRNYGISACFMRVYLVPNVQDCGNVL